MTKRYPIFFSFQPFVCLLLSVAIFSVKSEQLVVWHQKNDASPLLEQILAPVAQQYSLTLSVSYISTTDLKTALIKSVLNQSEPNLALVPSDFFGEQATLKLQPISDGLYQAASLEKSVWDFARLNDSIYGVPISVGNHLLLYFNKQHVASPVTQWQQLFELSKKQPIKRPVIGWNYKELFWFINFVPMFGEMPINERGLNLNSKAMNKAIKFYRELSRQGLIDQHCNYSCSIQRFKKGEFFYTINGDWAYRDLKNTLGDDLGVTALPSYQSAPMKSFYSAIAMMFPKGHQSEKQKEINQAIATALLSDSAQTLLFEKAGLLPAKKRLREGLVAKANADYADIIHVLESGIQTPSTPAMSAAWAGMRKGIDYYFENNVSEERAANIMQRVAQRQLQALNEKR